MGDRRDCWSQALLEWSYKEFTFACELAGCYLARVLMRITGVKARHLWASGPYT